MMPATQAEKRIVVEHANGIVQICGLVSEGQPDVFIPPEISGWDYAVQLVASKPRYWLYRAIVNPSASTTGDNNGTSTPS